jgi:hypothetical protein
MAHPLENIANNSSANRAERRSDLRKRRYLGRSILWQESNLKRVRDCGRVAVTPLTAPRLPLRLLSSGSAFTLAGFSRDALWSHYTRGPAGAGLLSSSGASRCCVALICRRGCIPSSCVHKHT